MSDIERAIEGIETGMLNGQEIQGWTFHSIRRELLVTALAALREKAEREKGCKYCGLIYKLDGAAYGTVDELIDNTFCPMCGKAVGNEAIR